jgi:hypothetical protein
MRKLIFIFLSIFLCAHSSRVCLALDPVAPKVERAFGFVQVVSPLPDSDQCALFDSSGARIDFKPGQMMKVPVGEYTLKVKLQNDEWSKPVMVTPTEFTYVAVPGFGNLKVKTPSPESDTVEIYSEDGSFLRSFPASQTETIPMGTYQVKVKMGSNVANHPSAANGYYSMVSKDRVMIFPLATREIDVSF